jgi:hypothetical protein
MATSNSELQALKQDIHNLRLDVLSKLREVQPKQDTVPDNLTRVEAAAFLRMSLTTLHKHLRAGMPSFKAGRKRLFEKQKIYEYFISINRAP